MQAFALREDHSSLGGVPVVHMVRCVIALRATHSPDPLGKLTETHRTNDALKVTSMSDLIQTQLQQSGLHAREAKIATLGGRALWVVSVRWAGQSFVVQSETRERAWKQAWNMANRLHLTDGNLAVSVPFRERSLMSNRAG